ncbi:uncharacterized protein G2W53_028956 [Senna tora]|uniref:Uncharacterized protein n=1 Tax=Senna tora TaxID=362788 RepID=A0A834WA90_9FABA|nr:uncharacterized protein G2W53_028956 [Senna tora]
MEDVVTFRAIIPLNNYTKSYNKGTIRKKLEPLQAAASQMIRTELFKVLCDRGLTYPRPGKIWTTPCSSWFKVDWLCIFHQNIPGRFSAALKTSSQVPAYCRGQPVEARR